MTSDGEAPPERPASRGPRMWRRGFWVVLATYLLVTTSWDLNRGDYDAGWLRWVDVVVVVVAVIGLAANAADLICESRAGRSA